MTSQSESDTGTGMYRYYLLFCTILQYKQHRREQDVPTRSSGHAIQQIQLERSSASAWGGVYRSMLMKTANNNYLTPVSFVV